MKRLLMFVGVAVVAAAMYVAASPASQQGSFASQKEVTALKKQVARRLGIGEGTVHTHVTHIYEKIGVNSRAAAALFAMEHQLLEP